MEKSMATDSGHIKAVVAGAVALMMGLSMFTMGAGTVEIVYSIVNSIVKAVTNGTTTLGILSSAANQAKTVIPMLGIVFVAAGGGLVLWGLFKMFGGTPLSKYWE
jgi:hypothetical protein